MSGALLVLIVLLGATPAILLAGSLIVEGSAFAIVAGAIVVVARAIRPGEIAHLATLVGPAALLAAVPAAWMVIQLLPIPGLANPMWDSAAAALGQPLAGTISIDTGATLLALAHYVAAAGVALLATAVGLDRQRAEWLLFALMAATAVVSVVVIADAAGLPATGAGARRQALDCVALGLVVAAATGLRTFERFETRHASPGRSGAAIAAAAAGCGTAFILGVVATALGPPGFWFAELFGLATLAAVVVIRRLGLGPWGTSGIAAAAVAVAIGVIAGHDRPAHPTLAFAPAGTPVATALHILADAPWTGTGAGTFAALAAIYRDDADGAGEAAAAAPTSAAQIAVELGWPAPAMLLLIATVALMLFLRGALRRGRDSFYPAAGAGCAVVLMILGFGNAGLLAPAPAIVAAATVGLALAQSRSRTAQPT